MKQAFAWTDECEAAFQKLKRYLYLYLAVLTTAMSAALIREEDRKQFLDYYVSQAFQGAEAKYPRIEKIMFMLIVASCKLRP